MAARAILFQMRKTILIKCVCVLWCYLYNTRTATIYYSTYMQVDIKPKVKNPFFFTPRTNKVCVFFHHFFFCSYFVNGDRARYKVLRGERSMLQINSNYYNNMTSRELRCRRRRAVSYIYYSVNRARMLFEFVFFRSFFLHLVVVVGKLVFIFGTRARF